MGSPPDKSRDGAVMYRTEEVPMEGEQSAYRVGVFYATDRLPLSSLAPSGLWERYGSTLVAAAITLVFGLGAWLFSRKILLAVLAFGMLLISGSWWYAAHLEAEKADRLAANGNRIYGNVAA